MTEKERVATTIFLDADLHEKIKFHFRRSKAFKFQWVGEALFKAWFAAGMSLESFSPQIPRTDDPVLSRALRIMDLDSPESDTPLSQAVYSQAQAFRKLVEIESGIAR